MELGFIAHACRRYAWLVLVGALLGTAAGSLLASGGPAVYTSEGLLGVQAPSGAPQSDRYVATQMVILTSSGVTKAVSERPDVGLEPSETRLAVDFEQVPGTDVVSITASASRPELAQAIVQGYVEVYMGFVRTQYDDGRLAELAALEESIAAVEERLTQVDARAEELTAPYLGNTVTGIPTIEQLDPALATMRNALTEQYRQLLTARSAFDLTTTDEVSSRLVQGASVPAEPSTSEQPLFVVVGMFLGTILGVTGATVAARLSSKVLDAGEAEDIMRTPFVGSLPFRRRYTATLDEVLFGPESFRDRTIRQLSVRAQAATANGESLAILVTGTATAVGTSTVAALMARSLAEEGHHVLIVDADVNTPDLSDEVRSRSEPIEKLVADVGPGDTRRGTRTRRRESAIEVGAASGTIQVAAFREGTDRIPQLGNVADLLAGARRRARVVVIDGGPLMDSASTVMLSRSVDAVVLAVPVARQRVEPLRVVSGQLGQSEARLLPVRTPSLRRARLGARSAPVATSDRALENV
jgi:Mrp family chromosome partitioning ATPase